MDFTVPGGGSSELVSVVDIFEGSAASSDPGLINRMLCGINNGAQISVLDILVVEVVVEFNVQSFDVLERRDDLDVYLSHELMQKGNSSNLL